MDSWARSARNEFARRLSKILTEIESFSKEKQGSKALNFEEFANRARVLAIEDWKALEFAL